MKRLRIVLLLLFVVAFVGFVVFAVLSERRRVGIMAAIEVPAEVVFHGRLAEAIQNTNEDVPPLPELKPTLDVITSWAALFERKRQEIDGDEWNAIRDQWHSAGGWDGLSPEDKARIFAFLDEHRDFIAALREQATRGGPVQAVPLCPSSENKSVDHLGPMRDCAHLLALDTIARAHIGSVDQAIDDCIAGMQLSDALALEPAFMSQLVRYSLTGITYRAIQEAFVPGQLSPEATARLICQAQVAVGRDALALGLRYYQLGLNEGNNEMMAMSWFDRHEEMKFIGAGERRLKVRVFKFAYASPLARPWLNKDVARASERMSHMVMIARLPYHEAIKNMDVRHERPLRFQSPYAALVAGVELPTLQGQANHEVRLQLLQIGLTLEGRHATHGAFPASLDTLLDTLPDETLVDPFTGDRFTYQPGDDGFRLYSVGRNLRDDGGLHDLASGDFVWRGEKTD